MVKDLRDGSIHFIYILDKKYGGIVIVNTQKNSVAEYLINLQGLVSSFVCKDKNHYEYVNCNNITDELIIADLSKSKILELPVVGEYLEINKKIDFEKTDNTLSIEGLSSNLKLSVVDVLLIALKQKAWTFYQDDDNHVLSSMRNIINRLVHEVNLKQVSLNSKSGLRNEDN